jgi:hypothetical protein
MLRSVKSYGCLNLFYTLVAPGGSPRRKLNDFGRFALKSRCHGPNSLIFPPEGARTTPFRISLAGLHGSGNKKLGVADIICNFGIA